MLQLKWLLALVIMPAFLSACSDSKDDLSGPSGQESTIPLSLSIEVPVESEEDALRSLSMKLDKRSDGKIIPRPAYTHGAKVPVITMLASNAGDYGYAVLNWTYNGRTRSLVLSPEDGSISVPNFNNDGGRKWFIAGLIANGTAELSTNGTLTLKNVDYAPGPLKGGAIAEDLLALKVPYKFDWTEVTVDTTREKIGSSYTYGIVPKTTSIKFKPIGSVIALRLGNQLITGNHSFELERFTLHNLGLTNRLEALRVNLRRGPLYGSEIYTGAPATMVSANYDFGMIMEFALENKITIPHGSEADKTYYIWVYPFGSIAGGETNHLNAMMIGKSSDPTRTDYTNTYYTDYGINWKERPVTAVQQGVMYTLRANVTHRVPLPIELVAEYDLAGGSSLQYSSTTIPGTLGPLRFSNRDASGVVTGDGHATNRSGYYSCYHINPFTGSSNSSEGALVPTTSFDGMLLDIDGQTRPYTDRYFVPRAGDWSGIFPSRRFSRRYPNSAIEAIRIGGGADRRADLRYALYRYYSSEYGPLSSETNEGYAEYVLYGIRLKGPSSAEKATHGYELQDDHLVDYANNSFWAYLSPAPDDNFKCAYRYRWRTDDAIDLLQRRLIIEVVHLGDEGASPTALSTISSPAWWSQKEAEGKLIRRVFPLVGYSVRDARQEYDKQWVTSTSMPLESSTVYMSRSIGSTIELNTSGFGRPSGSTSSPMNPNLSVVSRPYYAFPIRLFREPTTL